MNVPAQVPEVEASEGAARVDQGALLLDVRQPEEWDAGRAPAATLIPLGELEARLDELPTDREIVCVCRTGARSAHAAAFLATQGRTAMNLWGGMLAWEAEGLPIEADGGAVGYVL
jgi:rhodanese-related sulfurtransferase